MPIVTHLPVNTGQWEGDHREPGADSRKPTASIFFRLSSKLYRLSSDL